MSAGAYVLGGDGRFPGPLDEHVGRFVEELRALGYSKRRLFAKRRAVESFACWAQAKPLVAVDLNEDHVAEYVARTPRRSKADVACALKLFLRHLRQAGLVPAASARVDTTPAGALERSYADYLHRERGLSERSLLVYVPFVRKFLASCVVAGGSAPVAAFNAPMVRAFLLERVRGRSSGYARLLAASLRSFLHFLFLRGETATDLSPSVVTVRTWRGARVHAFLSPEEVERVLSTPDPTTPTGCRDHAILLLLARLGLRAGEVVALELSDLGWRTGEIVVRGKGRVLDRMPLPSDVGKALARYLKSHRGSSASRRVFLRRKAPRVGLTGPASVGHVVRLALAGAGLRAPSRRGAAHLFRHSLATRMVRHGASLAEISEVLRHRSQGTTEIYAKVAFDALREVSRPWPETERAR